MTALPVLYSFRRCPYAMRARLAIRESGLPVELREVVLRDKPAEMLEASPKGTVPVLVLRDGSVLEESLDVIDWAIETVNDHGWTQVDSNTLSQMRLLIEECDGPFKSALDRYKYPNRYDAVDRLEQRAIGSEFISKLDARLDGHSYLFGEQFSLADGAILPFVRQFAHVDMDWFYSQDWPEVIRWLDAFKESERFADIMKKYPQWVSGEEGVRFGG